MADPSDKGGSSPERLDPSPHDALERETLTLPDEAGLFAGRFRLDGEIGRGGMGVVYRAWDTETNEAVALKMLRPEIANDPHRLARFRSELRIAKTITHKNVCRTYDLHRDGDQVAIAMELVEGRTLRSLLRPIQGVAVPFGLRIAKELIEGLKEAHAQGVVHRDLKPDNIVLSSEGTVKLMDFGIARSYEEGLTAEGAVIGTASYMSPEQARGETVDSRSDIYSLGVVLFELFTGRLPFSGDNAGAVMHQQMHEKAPSPTDFNPHLPAFLSRAIERCLEKKPDRRYPSLEDLATALTGKRARGQDAEAQPLPVNLRQPGRLDAALFGLGLAGLLGFVLLAPRASLDSGLKLELPRSVLINKAQEELSERGWKGEVSWLSAKLDSDLTSHLVEKLGFEEARKTLIEAGGPYEFMVRATGGAVTYALDGTIRSIELPVEEVVSLPALSQTEALSLSRNEILSVFGDDVSQFELQYEGPTYQAARQGHRYVWAREGPASTRVRIEATVYDRVTLLEKDLEVAGEGTAQETKSRVVEAVSNFIGIVGPASALVLAVWLCFARHLYNEIGLAQTLSASLFTLPFVVAQLTDPESTRGIGGIFIIAPAVLLGSLVVWFVLTLVQANLHLSKSVWPAAAATLRAALRFDRLPTSTGLSVFRGVSAAMLGLGIAATIQWLRVSAGRAPDEPMAWAALSRLPAAILLGEFLLWALGALVLLVYLSLCAHWTQKTWFLALIGAGLLLLASPQWTQDLTALPSIALAGAGFVLLLRHGDYLTVMVAAGTFGLARATAPVLSVLSEIGAPDIWVLLLLFALLFLWALHDSYRALWTRLGSKLSRRLEL